MPSLEERIRTALAPQYAIEEEIASGGMGIVYRARDVTLERRVAVKVLRPELCTAVAARRFLREARTLARLSHPNIIHVYQAGEVDGLLYYVMDFVEGDTLAARLERGPLEPSAFLGLARDLFQALVAAHNQGVVHRDLKPSNIMLVQKQALLGDFGIAQVRADAETGLTAPGQMIGTLGYMAPEQLAGGEVTIQSDIYSAGIVLYEACTGRRWEVMQAPDAANWDGVPASFVVALRRALALSPEERWATIADFQRAAFRRTSIARRLAIAVPVVAALGIVAALWRGPRPGTQPPGLATTLIAIGPFETQSGQMRALSDTLARALVQALGGHPDFTAVPGDSAVFRTRHPVFSLRGTIEPSVDGLWLNARLEARDNPARPVFGGPLTGGWQRAADSLRNAVENELWAGKLAADGYLPRDALPTSREGRLRWQQAERLYAQGMWQQADSAYRGAEAVDSSCLLCSYRIADIDRWLDRTHDPGRTRWLHQHLSRFPEHYRSVFLAMESPWPARYDSLAAVTRRYQDFAIGWYLLGDEWLHRGPLHGREQRQALLPLERAIQLKPGFAPAWLHLAWGMTYAGDSANSTIAVDSLLRIGATSGILHLLVKLGHAWRFGLSPELVTEAVLRDPRVSAHPDLGLGARLMMTFDAPDGAVYLGRRLATISSRLDLRLPGRVAQLVGYTVLGKLDSARAVMDAVRDFGAGPDFELFLAEYEGALALLHPLETPAARRQALQRLSRIEGSSAFGHEARARAVWMEALLHRAEGREGEARRLASLLSRDSLGVALAATLTGVEEASRGRFDRALELTAGLARRTAAHLPDPVVRAVLRLYRGRWREQAGDLAGAADELMWYQGQDFSGFPFDSPSPAEIDWAFGTVARWERGRVLERAGNPGRSVCEEYRAVRRLWGRADPPYRVLADSAGARLESLSCLTKPL